ncbi:MAG: GWxTD domain-containing protein [Candidatus Eisenbacteria bacterium]|nr:GWxTD domain-containing protein [Candidatus Eisenbacteria bacterium]
MALTSAFLLLGIPLLGLGGDEEPVPRFPVEATGDIHFQLDGARFVEDSLLVHEFYISIPQDELKPVVAGGDTAYQVVVRLEFRDDNGDPVLTREGELDLPHLAQSAGPGLPPAHTLTFRPQVPDQSGRVRTIVTDPNAGKRGLLYEIRGTRKSGQADAWFESAVAPREERISEILFVWSVSEPQETGEEPVDLSESGRALRRRILPNPSHFYGLYHRDLSFYYEIYPAPEHGDSATVLYEVERYEDSTAVRRTQEQISLRGGVHPIFRRFDVDNLEGGTYILSVAVRDASGEALARRRALFRVLWESKTWYLTEKELLEDASVLLTDEQYREFVLLDRGNQERFLDSFWKERDPTPETAVNERRLVFEKRKLYAQRHFGGFRKGKLSDRGRVYIRFGQPDEIEKELSPSERQALDEVIVREFDDEDLEYGVRPGAGTLHNISYEVWYYHLRGDPLFPEYVGPQVPAQVKFIFIDRMGIGEYTLLHTNVFGGFR